MVVPGATCAYFGAAEPLQVAVGDLGAGLGEQAVVQREGPARADRADEVDRLAELHPGRVQRHEQGVRPRSSGTVNESPGCRRVGRRRRSGSRGWRSAGCPGGSPRAAPVRADVKPAAVNSAPGSTAMTAPGERGELRQHLGVGVDRWLRPLAQGFLERVDVEMVGVLVGDQHGVRAGQGRSLTERAGIDQTKYCPDDVFQPSGTLCGDDPMGDCDAPDQCDNSGNCVDMVQPNTEVCRDAASDCDVKEKCTGTSKDCPDDVFQSSGTLCGDDPMGDCDAPDQCDNSGNCVDMVQPNTEVCRDAVSDCDVEEKCDGTSKDCPNDVFQPSGTLCGNDPMGDCDAPDQCDNSGNCVDMVQPNTEVCRDATGVCDVAEKCNG